MSPKEQRSTFTSTVGGVMTVEAGAITGELELATYPAEETLEVFVRYVGAEEWYTVEGSPVSLKEETAPGKLHKRVVAYLTKPGQRISGNEESVSLTSFSGNL